jgi:hypothetical protein
MTEAASPQANRVYSIVLMKKDSECCVYHVKVTAGVHREFFGEITASDYARDDVIKRIESLCESQFNRLPQDGGTIYLDLTWSDRDDPAAPAGA